MNVQERIKETIGSHRVVLFMKGTPSFHNAAFLHGQFRFWKRATLISQQSMYSATWRFVKVSSSIPVGQPFHKFISMANLSAAATY